MNPWAAPRLSMRFLPVYRRNLLVWRKLAVASVIGNIADPLIILVAFGYGLGTLLRQVDGVPYIVFLAAGSMCMSTMMAASFESLYSAFSRMHVQRTWDSLLNAPLELDDIVIAEWLWAATKSVLSGLAIVTVVWLLDISREPTLVLALPVVALTGLVFGAIGLCVNALARGYDFFTYYFTLVLTPMIFLSGVYYPMAQLPDWLAALANALPLAAAVELARPLVLGRLPEAPLLPLLTLLAYAGGALYLAMILTRRRFVA
ncbi:MAG: nodulation protein NodJ [Lautropia sp.]|nr:MAG: nodulation protein NodJ [Pseudomonadota bacterium]MBC6958997.1 nodulation protein NodJ [Lautropia sp.]MDL1906259.1 nodulation protein NodJ [Betaproteobacteria bacterium PRO1]MEB2335639.1 ABC transporter permease [Burkholderiales bacterium]RIK90299.1 MAG: nodulation protein NodJ [Burkholderiales bacterium]